MNPSGIRREIPPPQQLAPVPTNSHEREPATDETQGDPQGRESRKPVPASKERGDKAMRRSAVGHLVPEDGVSGEVGEDRALCLMAISRSGGLELEQSSGGGSGSGMSSSGGGALLFSVAALFFLLLGLLL